MGRIRDWFNRDMDKRLAMEVCDMFNEKTKNLTKEKKLAVYKEFLKDFKEDEQFARILVNEHKDHLPTIEGQNEINKTS